MSENTGRSRGQLFRRTEASRDLSGHPAERNSAHDSAAGPGDPALLQQSWSEQITIGQREVSENTGRSRGQLFRRTEASRDLSGHPAERNSAHDSAAGPGDPALLQQSWSEQITIGQREVSENTGRSRGQLFRRTEASRDLSGHPAERNSAHDSAAGPGDPALLQQSWSEQITIGQREVSENTGRSRGQLFRRTEASRDLSGHPAERNSAHDSAAGPGDPALLQQSWSEQITIGQREVSENTGRSRGQLFRRTEASRDLSGHPAERNSAHDSAAGPGDPALLQQSWSEQITIGQREVSENTGRSRGQLFRRTEASRDLSGHPAERNSAAGLQPDGARHRMIFAG